MTDTLATPTVPDLPLTISVPSLDAAAHSRTAIGVTTVGGAATAKPVQRAPPYDGLADWDAYRTQFEILANINCWTEVEKATYLAVSLKGPALTVLSNLPADNLYNYSSLVSPGCSLWELSSGRAAPHEVEELYPKTGGRSG